MSPATLNRAHSRAARRVGAVSVLAAVAAAHAVVLWREPPTAVAQPPARLAMAVPSSSVTVRTVAAARPPLLLPEAAPEPTPVPAARPATAGVIARPAARPVALNAATAEAPVEAALPPPTFEPVPRYRTLLPPAATLHYTLLRGGLAERAELRWQPDAARYRITLLGYRSEGGFDADGIAPERHTESRRGREWRAVNFQREAGRISFSASQHSAALTPGSQDRLSWLVQLAGVLAADPALRAAGSGVQMVVAGVRGEATVWRFEVLGDEALDLPAGPVALALHLRREPGGLDSPYAQAVDVWLDPAQGYLPVQLLMQRPGAPPPAPGSLLLQWAAAAP